MKTKICRPVLIESNEPSIIGRLKYGSSKLVLYPNPIGINNGDGNGTLPQQLILISLVSNEKIEAGDLATDGIDLCRITDLSNEFYSIESLDKKIKFENKPIGLLINGLTKVTATQSQLHPEYIQQFIEKYNKHEVKDVEIEMEMFWNNKKFKHQPFPDEFATEKDRVYDPKLTNGFVTIVETDTEEDFIKVYDNIGGHPGGHWEPKKPITYTEEKVIGFLNIFQDDLKMVPFGGLNTKIWFDQYKNKQL